MVTALQLHSKVAPTHLEEGGASRQGLVANVAKPTVYIDVHLQTVQPLVALCEAKAAGWVAGIVENAQCNTAKPNVPDCKHHRMLAHLCDTLGESLERKAFLSFGRPFSCILFTRVCHFKPI